MIEYARARMRARGLARRSTLVAGDMERIDRLVQASSVHFAFNTINSIRHLTTDAALDRHLRAMSRVLVARGIYAVGLSMSDYEHETESEDVWEGARGRCRVTQVVQYLPPTRRRRIETVISHLSIERPRGVEHIDSRYELRAYDLRQWLERLDASPLSLEAVVDEHGRDVDVERAGYAIFILRRVTRS